VIAAIFSLWLHLLLQRDKGSNTSLQQKTKELQQKSVQPKMSEVSETECIELIAQVRGSFKTGKTHTYEWRYAQLLALKRLVKENEKAIVEAMASDLGNKHICISICFTCLLLLVSIYNMKEIMKEM
jgi:acyl-CoA reductase-like NAD-dependent aldehyde dehydrogenase